MSATNSCNTKIKCPLCEGLRETLVCRSHLTGHISHHFDYFPIGCITCGEKFGSKEVFEWHVRQSSHPKEFTTITNDLMEEIVKLVEHIIMSVNMGKDTNINDALKLRSLLHQRRLDLSTARFHKRKTVDKVLLWLQQFCDCGETKREDSDTAGDDCVILHDTGLGKRAPSIISTILIGMPLSINDRKENLPNQNDPSVRTEISPVMGSRSTDLLHQPPSEVTETEPRGVHCELSGLASEPHHPICEVSADLPGSSGVSSTPISQWTDSLEEHITRDARALDAHFSGSYVSTINSAAQFIGYPFHLPDYANAHLNSRVYSFEPVNSFTLDSHNYGMEYANMNMETIENRQLGMLSHDNHAATNSMDANAQPTATAPTQELVAGVDRDDVKVQLTVKNSDGELHSSGNLDMNGNNIMVSLNANEAMLNTLEPSISEFSSESEQNWMKHRETIHDSLVTPDEVSKVKVEQNDVVITATDILSADDNTVGDDRMRRRTRDKNHSSMKPKASKRKMNILKTSGKKNRNPQYVCRVCNVDFYQDKSEVDWLECLICERYEHESCGTTTARWFYCHSCTDPSLFST